MVLLLLCAIAAAKTPRTEATEAYRAGRFERAAELFAKVVEAEKGGPGEREAREKLVLSLYAAKKRNAAVTEYKALLAAFPDFRFDPDRISPDTVHFFEDEALEPVEPPKEMKAAPSTTEQPRAIATAQPEPKKQWHWYYLTPLGIGQFLAGSPVRGTIFAVLQVGLITMNAVCYALLMRELRPDGTVQSRATAYPLQVMTNVGFFGWIAALTAGTVDGAFFEP